MTITNSGTFCQVAIPSGEPCIRTIASILRRYGYAVKTFSMGAQVTRLGTLKLTMIDVRPGRNADTYGEGDCRVDDCIRAHAGYVDM